MADAGWYHDPSDPARERWWDGGAWTARTRPLEPVEGARPSDPTTVRRPTAGNGDGGDGRDHGAAPTDDVAGSTEPPDQRPSWPTPAAAPSWATPPPPRSAPPPPPPRPDGSPGDAGGPRRSRWLVPAVAVGVVLVLVAAGLLLVRTLGGGDDDAPTADPSTEANGTSDTAGPSDGGSPTASPEFCTSGDPFGGPQRNGRVLVGGGLTMPIPSAYQRYDGIEVNLGFATDLDSALHELTARLSSTYTIGSVSRADHPDPADAAAQIVLCVTESLLYANLRTERTLSDPEETTVAGRDAWSAGAIMRLEDEGIEGGDVLAVLVDTGANDTWGFFLGIVASDDDLGGTGDVTERDRVLGTLSLD